VPAKWQRSLFLVRLTSGRSSGRGGSIPRTPTQSSRSRTSTIFAGLGVDDRVLRVAATYRQRFSVAMPRALTADIAISHNDSRAAAACSYARVRRPEGCSDCCVPVVMGVRLSLS
jgi:hypothetical protein